MASNIRGIKIEIGASTTGLQKALEGVNKKSRDLQKELRQVEKLLNMDPGNTELLAQKQELLAEAVENSAEKLQTLKDAQAQVDAQFARGEISNEQYRAFGREVAKAEQELNNFERQLEETGGAAKNTGIDIDKMNESLKNTGDKVKGAGEKFAPASAAAAGLLAGLVANTEATREYREDIAKLETAFEQNNFTAEQGKQIYSDLFAVMGEEDRSVETANHIAQLADTEKEANEWTTILTGAWATFGDSLPIEGLAEAANETAKVGKVTGPLADALNWLGVSEDEVNAKLETLNTEQEREAYLRETLLGLYGDTAAAYEENNEGVMEANRAQEKLTDSLAKLGETVEPIVTRLKEAVAGLVEKFTEMDPVAQNAIIIGALIVAAISPLLMIIGSLLMVLPLLTTAIGAISAPVLIVVGVIAGLIAIGVLLYKNWDTIKAKASEIWENVTQKFNSAKESIGTIIENLRNTVTTKFNQIKSTITTPINNAISTIKNGIGSGVSWITSKFNSFRSTVSGIFNRVKSAITGPINDAITTIKGWLSRLKLPEIKIPKIKLPHFKITGKFDLVPPGLSVPKISVSWYDEGGIFRNPAIIGVAERRPEFVGALDDLRYIVRDEIRAAQPAVATAGPEIHLHIGTLVADDMGLKKLEQTLRKYRIYEDQRREGA